MISKGDVNISAIYKGSVKFAKAYLGDKLILSDVVGVDWIELRVDTATPAQRVFTDLDINEVDTWAGGVTPAVASRKDISGNDNNADQDTTSLQPSYDSSSGAMIFSGSQRLVANDVDTSCPRFRCKFKFNIVTGGEDGFIMSKRDTSTDREFYLLIFNGRIFVTLVTDNGTFSFTGGIAMLNGENTYEVDTYYDCDNSQLVLSASINGGIPEVLTTSATGDILQNSASLSIGTSLYGGFPFLGSIFYAEYSDFASGEVFMNLPLLQ